MIFQHSVCLLDHAVATKRYRQVINPHHNVYMLQTREPKYSFIELLVYTCKTCVDIDQVCGRATCDLKTAYIMKGSIVYIPLLTRSTVYRLSLNPVTFGTVQFGRNSEVAAFQKLTAAK